MAAAPGEMNRIGARALSVVGATGASRVGAIATLLVGAVGASRVSAMALLLVGATASSSANLSAHHSVLAFDGAAATTIRGTVVRILWQDPHAMIAIDVEADRWTIESEGATALQRLGWTRVLLQAGDRILVTGARAKDGRRLMRCTTITINDRQLPCFGSPS